MGLINIPNIKYCASPSWNGEWIVRTSLLLETSEWLQALLAVTLDSLDQTKVSTFDICCHLYSPSKVSESQTYLLKIVIQLQIFKRSFHYNKETKIFFFYNSGHEYNLINFEIISLKNEPFLIALNEKFHEFFLICHTEETRRPPAWSSVTPARWTVGSTSVTRLPATLNTSTSSSSTQVRRAEPQRFSSLFKNFSLISQFPLFLFTPPQCDWKESFNCLFNYRRYNSETGRLVFQSSFKDI